MKARNSSATPLDGLHRFAIFLAACTLGLVFAGGLVTSKGAGLAVPDWPLSYGKLFPDRWMEVENIRAEHGHRLIAGAVAVLTLIFAVWVWRKEPRRWVRWVAVATLGAVVLQAILGGITVRFLLPTPVSVSHALLAQTFLCLTVCMALFTSRGWRKERITVSDPSGVPLRLVCLGLTLTIYGQLALGALMRHTDSGLAIDDFPLAFGRLIPSTSEEAIRAINLERLHGRLYLGLNLPSVTAPQILIHFAHRVGALLVCLAGIGIGFRVLGKHRDDGALLFPTLLILALLVCQIMLGAATIWTGKQPHIATAHVTVGAAILASSVVLTVQAFRLVRPSGGRAEAGAGALRSKAQGAAT